jgi:hypothetical protein
VLSGTNQIFIGASNKTTIINGATNINTTGSATTTIGNILSTINISGSTTTIDGGSLSLAKSATTGNIIIGEAQTSGTIEIGSSTRTGEIHIGRNTNGNIGIGDASTGTGKYLVVGTALKSLTYVRGDRVTLCDGGGETYIIGNVTLGANTLINPNAASTNITLGTANSVFRLYTPITPLYGYPVGSSSIGAIVNGTLSTGYTSPGGLGAIVYVSTSGVWNFSWNIQFVVYYVTYVRPDFRIPGVTSFNVQCSVMFGQSNYFLMSGSYTSYVTSGTNGYGALYMNFDTNPSGYSIVDIYGNIRAVRIA